MVPILWLPFLGAIIMKDLLVPLGYMLHHSASKCLPWPKGRFCLNNDLTCFFPKLLLDTLIKSFFLKMRKD